MKKYHYTYRITNKKLNKHYYGTRSSKIKPKEDIGIYYFSSSHDKWFIQDQKDNPQDYRYKVLYIFSTRKEALEMEIKLHNKFNVGLNESFFNKSKQTSTGFDNTGLNFLKIARLEQEKGNYIKRGITAKQTWKNKSDEEMQQISKKFKESFSKIDLIDRAEKAVISRKLNDNLPKGNKNGRALKILIFDNNDILRFTCHGNFLEVCKENNLPAKALSKSYRNEGKKIYTGRIQKIVKDMNFDQYIGWYAIKI